MKLLYHKFFNVRHTLHLFGVRYTLHIYKECKMNEDSLVAVLGVGVAYIAALIPIAITFIVFSFQAKEKKEKYDAMIEVSKNIEDPAVVEDLLASFKEAKKSPRDYRKDGVTTAFTGIGLFLFGIFFLGDILKGIGALVFTIGIGLLIAGYLYPRESDEINKAVEDFEKR